MATGRKFKVTNGLDNNANQIDNIGATGAHLTRSGAHVLTLTTTATTNVTLPSGTVTLAKTSGETMTNLILSGTLTAGGGNGTSGQLLSSTGTGVQWINAPTTGVQGTGTTNTIAYWVDSTTIGALATATYPSLTELSYVKGVTSAIQTQINNKFTLPSLTSGSVLFSDGSPIAQDNANLYWDNSNNRLGIGTTTPASRIDSLASSGAQLRLSNDANNFTTFTVDSTGGLTIGFEGTGIGGQADLTLNHTNVYVAGNLTVSGTTTNINTTNLLVEDKNIVIGDVASPSNTTADGGGITLKGTTDKTINWVNATGAWTSSEDFNLLTGKVYEINGTEVLSATALGSGVTSSSLTSVGTITSGTWSATTIATNKGGTGLTSFTSGGAVYATSTSALTTGTLPVASGGTGITSFGTGVATALGQNVQGSGSIVLATSPTLTTPNIGVATATSVATANSLVGSATVTTTSTSQATVSIAASATYRSVKATISASNSTTSNFATTEVLLVHDGTTVYLTEYGSVNSGTSPWTTIDADINSGNIRLLVTSSATSSTVYKIHFNAVAI